MVALAAITLQKAAPWGGFFSFAAPVPARAYRSVQLRLPQDIEGLRLQGHHQTENSRRYESDAGQDSCQPDTTGARR